MFDALSSKQKIIFSIIIILMLIVIIYYFYTTFYQEDTVFPEKNVAISTNFIVQNTPLEEPEITFENLQKDEIIVYICGAVQESKVISLKENSRIADAIEAVGGLTPQADLTNVNLAYILEDGEKIYIPSQEENLENVAIITSSAGSSSSDSSILQNKININKAGQAELEGLPGIGPSTALKIIQYRNENGNFSSIEDLKNIAGIGENKYQNLKNYITVK